jgi:hypothetical protein
MMQTFDPVSFDAFARLLARPDPGDLPRRTHVYRYEGDPNRRTTRLPGILMRWLQRRHLEIDIEEPLSSARTLKRSGAAASNCPGPTPFDRLRTRRSQARVLQGSPIFSMS